MKSSGPLRIATRASRLALWQAHHVANLLRGVTDDCDVELVEVSTHGDRDRTEKLSEMGGVGVFTREVQHAVLDGRADVAVHSLKDLPTEPVVGLTLAGIPSRGSRFDVLVLPLSAEVSVLSLDDLPSGARIGTGSIRRQAQLLHHRSDLLMMEIRGNVETRLQKLDDGAYDALVLAQAGLERLGLATNHRLMPLLPPLMLPAVGQAALGLECRSDDRATMARLQAITDRMTEAEVISERACLRELRAGCHAPVGVLTELTGQSLVLSGVVLAPDGKERIEAAAEGEVATAAEVGGALAALLRERGAQKHIDAR